MPSLSFGEFRLHCEAPEAARYRACVLVLPGLFQSFACWRPVTSMLAHRGWEVYCLSRTMPDREGRTRLLDDTWEGARGRVLEVGRRLATPLVLLGSDLGAALALSVARELPVPALALFSPSDTVTLAAAYRRSVGRLAALGVGTWLSGLRSRGGGQETECVGAHRALLGPRTRPEDMAEEPRRLLEQLSDERLFARPDDHPPALVFAAGSDPLVAEQHALGFADGVRARASRTRLNGRFFPQTAGAELAGEVQRFLVLTLGDRVVDFPQEILED